MVFQIRGRAKLFVFIEITEQELKKKILTRTGRLIIRYAPSAKAQDAQWAYVGRYRHRFNYVCQKQSFGDALRSLP